jgi:hypothetical protein
VESPKSVLMLKVLPPLHDHVHLYLKQALGPLFQKLAVRLAGLVVGPAASAQCINSRRSRWITPLGGTPLGRAHLRDVLGQQGHREHLKPPSGRRENRISV